MDEARLKQILEDVKTPSYNPEARKGAISLARAAFNDAEKAETAKNEKSSQGNSLLARLMGNSNDNARRDPMEKIRRKNLYTGVAFITAGIALFSLPIVMEAMYQTVDSGATGASYSTATLEKVQFAIGEYDKPIRTAQNTVPAPAQPPAGSPAKESAQTWRTVQEERVRPELRAPKNREDMAQGVMAERKLIAPQYPASSSVIVADEIMPEPVPHPGYKDVGRDRFEDFKENPFKAVTEEPVSTFSVDVDTASYSFVRRQINHGVLPQKDAVRVEEMINYFDYNYPLPESREQPFKPTVTVIDSPWAEGKKLMQIGIRGYDIDEAEKPRSNLVFLLDVSGSMNSPDKLPLLKNSMKLLLDSLGPEDTVAIAVYAGAAGTVLEPTKASEKAKIIAALENLSAGGSTAGAEGINLAYQLAEQNFDKDAVNRVILATDGDFNVGITNHEELKDFVERKRETGIFLSVLGFGQGNLNDRMMQILAQNGNGVAAYIDNLNEARKVLVEEASSTLFPIARDVKIQVEFNPKTVAEYRLIGYETRALNREDFNNDAVDAGDIGAGHTVTALYEITPVGGPRSVDPLRYGEDNPDTDTRCIGQPGKRCAQEKEGTSQASHKYYLDYKTDFSTEYAFVKIRYKLPDEDISKLITTPVTTANFVETQECPPCPTPGACAPCPETANSDTLFAAAVAAFGQILKGGRYTGTFGYDDVIALARKGKGDDPFGYRAEFIQLVRLAKSASAIQPR